VDGAAHDCGWEEFLIGEEGTTLRELGLKLFVEVGGELLRALLLLTAGRGEVSMTSSWVDCGGGGEEGGVCIFMIVASLLVLLILIFVTIVVVEVSI